MTFYEYTQNNSGGHFEVNDKLCHRVFIEADNLDEADSIAESLGVYFNGVSDGIDCGCCGDRWYSGDEADLSESNIEEYAQFLADEYGWTSPDARIFYKDGTVTEINKRKGVR
ncbi:DUF7296 family protein [Bacillus altitudinis]|uniref:DUF7296 family protein n=1 Tax=Bacillus altitudinis TaxID=293387 RepID=UPI0011A3022B|nr:hypothetical protein [Bacillus altitudinis]